MNEKLRLWIAYILVTSVYLSIVGAYLFGLAMVIAFLGILYLIPGVRPLFQYCVALWRGTIFLTRLVLLYYHPKSLMAAKGNPMWN